MKRKKSKYDSALEANWYQNTLLAGWRFNHSRISDDPSVGKFYSPAIIFMNLKNKLPVLTSSILAQSLNC